MSAVADVHEGSDQRHPARREAMELVRAACGGLLFGIPLLYTMEMWWTGSRSHPGVVLVVLAGIYLALLMLNTTEGFRRRRDTQLAEAAVDAVIGLAVGLVTTLLVLVLLREVTVGMPVAPAVGMVVYESVPFCLGVGLARHLLHGARAHDDDGRPTVNPTLADLGATVIGAVFVSVSIAPTDEVVMLSAQVGPRSLLVLVAATLLISYAIVFVAGFWGQEGRHDQAGALQGPVAETVAAYLVSLAVALLLLSVFHRADVAWTELLDRVLILGLPAAVGGAAGRLAV